MQCSLFREEFEMPEEFGNSIPIQIPMLGEFGNSIPIQNTNARGIWKFNTNTNSNASRIWNYNTNTNTNARGFWKFNTQYKYKYMVNENTRRGVARKIYCSYLVVEYIHM